MTDSLVWVDVPCPLCGARRDEPLLMVPTAHGTCRLAKCGSCTLVYLNPRPSDETLGSLYPPDYHVYQSSPEPEGRGVVGYLRRLALSHYHGYPPAHAGLHRALAPVGKALLNWQGETLTQLPWIGEGRLLDYGCGSGWFAARMQQLGWQVTAMDFNAAALAVLAGRYRLPVIAGTLPHPKVKPDSFDVVTMNMVLEHVPDPHRVMAAAARALAAGGLLVVSVPCIGSWSFRTFGPDWWGLDLPRHLLHFSPATLRKLVEMHGLEVQEIRAVARPSWVRRSLKALRKRSGVGLARGLLCALAGLGPISRLIGRYAAETRPADTMKLLAVKPAAAALRLAA
jgi:SAM-dependent methyltransferase